MAEPIAEFMTPAEAGAMFKIPVRRIRDLIRQEEIPGVRLGRTYRVDRVALEEKLGRKMRSQKD